ncbi:MAG: bifunctional DNA primase/polymerase [Acidobacteria bacterium]|nr:bifunctional DNA primase/polymerase [Acidobacteriota bacterium]
MKSSPLLAQALEYTDRGFSVFPVVGKVPAVEWKPYQTRLPSVEEIKRNFSRRATGIAVVLGPVSGNLVCRDFDKHTSYENWKRAFPKVALLLPTVETYRGRHVYFRAQGVGIHDLGDGELRGFGGYVLLPESKHPESKPNRPIYYRWLRDGEIPCLHPEENGLSSNWTEVDREDRGEQKQTDVVCDGLALFKIRSIEDAVEKALPNGPSQNHHALFVLARALLHLQEYRRAAGELHQDETLDDDVLREAFDLWAMKAKEFLRADRSLDEYYFEFLEAWEKARVPFGQQELLEAAWRAACGSEPPATVLKKLSDERLRLLASLCRELQRRRPGKPFWLSCRTVCELFGLASPQTANSWLHGLVRLGILQVAERGTTGQNGQATRFIYIGGG